jgi:hypothetical protein
MTTDPDLPDVVIDAVLAVARDGQDVAGWLAGVLASAAAELGSTEALLAGRPGSWEAAAVCQLLTGTVGEADEYLADYMRGTPTARPE